jgi:hypothetical protein
MLDIRYPIGGMFVVLGLILVVFGLVSDPTIYQIHSLGVNVNLGWGCVLLVFGGCMLAMAWRARRRARKVELSQPEFQQREQGRPSSFKGNHEAS